MDSLSTEIITELLSKDEDVSQIILHNWDVHDKIIALGNNYTTAITRLIVNYEKNKTQLSKSYIFKIPSMSPLYEHFIKMRIYAKEILMYTEVSPKMHEYNENISARYFLTLDKYSLIIEDLTSSGYRMVSRRNQLDFEHSRLAFKCLAKYHALSIKLNQTNDIPQPVKEPVFDDDEMDEVFIKFFARGYDLFIEDLESPYKELYTQKLLKIKDNLRTTFVEEMKCEEDQFTVLNHGDFWLTNMMFRYSEYGTVEDIKLVDFQCANWTTPVVDILRFTISSVQFEVYEKYFHLLLEIYLETLNKMLKSFGASTYHMEDLRRDIDARKTYSLTSAICFLPMVLADMIEEDYDKMKDAMEDEELSDSVMRKMNDNNFSKNTVMKWFNHFIEKGVLDD